MAEPRNYGTAARRWEGIGPYYAMFPTHFADSVVAQYTRPGDCVIDPFAGRGTAVFSAAHQGRHGLGIEINPVGWVYAKTKLDAAPEAEVIGRLHDITALADDFFDEARSLPEFFHYCFSEKVRAYLLAARQSLDWQISRVDRTAMALLLVYLHGKKGAALSNQMRQTKSMAPDYAVRWWKERQLEAPDIDPADFIIRRLGWRYAKGTPVVAQSDVFLADSGRFLGDIAQSEHRKKMRPKLLLTSPPYFAVTNYHYDQWLRLWLLGGPPSARRTPGEHELRGRFENSQRYKQLLQEVFGAAGELMDNKSVVYVRTGLDRMTFETTFDVLSSTFPGHRIRDMSQKYSGPTQTRLFGDAQKKAGEIDLIMVRG